MITINVKTLTGRTIVLDLAPDTTIGEIKKLISLTQNMHVDAQRMIYSAQQLHDGVTLKEYGVKTGEIIYLMHRVESYDPAHPPRAVQMDRALRGMTPQEALATFHERV